VHGRSVVLCGDIGAGNVTKLANQIVVALNIAPCPRPWSWPPRQGWIRNWSSTPSRAACRQHGHERQGAMMMDRNIKPVPDQSSHQDLDNAMAAGHAVGCPALTGQAREIMEALKWTAWATPTTRPSSVSTRSSPRRGEEAEQ